MKDPASAGSAFRRGLISWILRGDSPPPTAAAIAQLNDATEERPVEGRRALTASAYEAGLLADLWRVGLRQANPFAAIVGATVVCLVSVSSYIAAPEDWAGRVYLPTLLGLYSVWVGVAMGRRWGGATTGTGTEAQGFLLPATRRQRYRASTWQGLIWSLVIWLLAAAGPLGILLLVRLRLAAIGSLSPFPFTGALIYPAGVALAFALSFRRFMNASSAADYRNARWPALGLAAAPVLLLESLPRTVSALPPDSPLWLLSPPIMHAPAGWFSVLVVSGLLVAAWRVYHNGLRDYTRKDAVDRPLASGAIWSDGGEGFVTRIGMLSLVAVIAAVSVWMPAIDWTDDAPNGNIGISPARNTYLAIGKTAGGAFEGTSLIKGDTAYVSLVNGIGVFDISKPGNPVMTGRVIETMSGVRTSGPSRELSFGLNGMIYGKINNQFWSIDSRDQRRPKLAYSDQSATAAKWTGGVVVAGSSMYGWFGSAMLRLDSRFPLSLRSLEEETLHDEILDVHVAASSTGKRGNDLIVLTSPDYDSRQIRAVLLEPDGRMHLSEGSMWMPDRAELLAVENGVVYLLTGDSHLQMLQMVWRDGILQNGKEIGTLKLPGLAPRGWDSDPYQRSRGRMYDGRLLFTTRYSRVLTLVDVADPTHPRLLSQRTDRIWDNDVQWSSSGLISAFSINPACVYAHCPGDTWHLLREETPGLLRDVMSRQGHSYEYVTKNNSGVWAQARYRTVQPLAAFDLPTRQIPNELHWMATNTDNFGRPVALNGEQVGFWVHGDRWCRVTDDAVVCRDIDNGGEVRIGRDVLGHRIHAPKLAATTEQYMIVTHDTGVLVLDLRKPGTERVVLDWVDPKAPAYRQRHEESHPGTLPPLIWAGLEEGHLLVLSLDVTMYRWRLGHWDSAPQRIVIPQHDDRGAERSIAQYRWLLLALRDSSSRLYLTEYESGWDPPIGKYTSSSITYDRRRILNLQSLPAIDVVACDEREGPESECNKIDRFVSGILRTDQGQALSVAYESVQWVDQVDPVRKPTVSSLRAEVEFTDAAFISPREAVLVTEDGNLVFVERRPVVNRLLDALWGRVVPQE